jgi:iron complex outermembrane recepter protein
MVRNGIMSCLLLFGCLPVRAQFDATQGCKHTLKGVILDNENHPMPFANVYIADLQRGTVADENGRFTLENLCNKSYTFTLTHVECEHKTQGLVIEGDMETVFILQHRLQMLQNVVITGKKRVLESIQTRSELSATELLSGGSANLGEMLKKINGVTALNTGATISKPVIRGLTGDRVLVIQNGVRQESQAWGMDHAPEIDPLSAGKIAVIKGANGVKYGSGAIGGVILVEPNPLRDSAGMDGFVLLTGQSNGRGGAIAGMLQGNLNENWSWRVQTSAQKAGTMNTPSYFLENSGVEGWNGAVTVRRKKKNVTQEFYYNHFYTKIGILKGSHFGNIADLERAIAAARPANADSATFGYSIQKPAQMVSHDLVKLNLAFPTKNFGKMNISLSGQYNLRQEFDAHRLFGNVTNNFDRADSGFELPTVALKADWEHATFRNYQGSLGFESSFQRNRAFAGNLIPDYRSYKLGAYWTERYKKYPRPLEIETGIRYDFQQTQMDKSTSIEYPTLNFHNISSSVGFIYRITENLKATANISTAWRAPNVNELYSKGVHHGTASYEAGNPNLKSEKALNADLNFEYGSQKVQFQINIFRNLVSNYIYLEPDTNFNPQLQRRGIVITIRGVFPKFDYQQTDATLTGADASMNWNFVPNFSCKIRYSTLYAKNTIQNEYLPLMPPSKIENEWRYEKNEVKSNKYLKKWHCSVNLIKVFEQERLPIRISDFKDAPDGYVRADASAGAECRLFGKVTEVNLTVNNVSNTIYRDYLDRFRYFTDATGRNIGIHVKTFL